MPELVQRASRLRQAIGLLRGQRRWLALLIVLTVVLAFANALEPLVLKFVFDGLATGGEQLLVRGVVAFVGLGLLRELLAALSGWMTWRSRLTLQQRLLDATVGKLHRMPLVFYRGEGVGAIMTRLDRGIQGVMDASTQIAFNVLPSLGYLVVSVIVMLQLDLRLALLVLVLAPLPPLIATWAAPRQTRREQTLLERWMKIYSRFNEVLSGIVTVRSFVREEVEKRRFVEDVSAANRLVLSGVAFDVRVQAGQNFTATLARASALAVGGWLALGGEITIGTLIAFLGYVTGLFGPVQGLSAIFTTARKARASFDAVFGILESQDMLGDAPDAVELANVRGTLSFDAVRFRYGPDRPWILDGFELEVAAGETLALVGPSGSGKSTVTVLLQRFYDPDAGTVRVDGIDVRRVKQESLRRSIGVVFQDSLLLNDTLAANIAFGRPEASREEILAAARAALVDDFARRLPDGYDTMVGERGSMLSSGERQRVAIARALLKDPPILVLDEATSMLDPESEALVAEAIERLRRGRTALIVAHRLVTVVGADRVCLLEAGRVRACASHAELLAHEPAYASMVRKQVGGLLGGAVAAAQGAAEPSR